MDGYQYTLGQRIVMANRLAIEAQVQTVLDRVSHTRKQLVGGADVHDGPLAAIGLNARGAFMNRAVKLAQQHGRPN